jgi:hypothetical protein
MKRTRPIIVALAVIAVVMVVAALAAMLTYALVDHGHDQGRHVQDGQMMPQPGQRGAGPQQDGTGPGAQGGGQGFGPGRSDYGEGAAHGNMAPGYGPRVDAGGMRSDGRDLGDLFLPLLATGLAFAAAGAIALAIWRPWRTGPPEAAAVAPIASPDAALESRFDVWHEQAHAIETTESAEETTAKD